MNRFLRQPFRIPFLVPSAILVAAILLLVLPSMALANPGPWESHGPSAAAFDAPIQFSPAYASDHTMFAFTDGGGVFKSTDGGGNWISANAGISNYFLGAGAVSPNYSVDGTVFAGSALHGIFRSTNSGGTWTAADNGLTNQQITGIAFSPAYATDDTVFVATRGGVFKSINEGGLWTATNSGLPELSVEAVAVSPNFATDNTLFVALDQQGVYKSTDGGASWTPTGTFSDPRMTCIAVSPNFAVDHALLAGGFNGTFISTDGGATWNPTGATSGVTYSVAFSPNFATDNTVFRGGSWWPSKSTNGGATWNTMSNGMINPGAYAVSVSPNYSIDHTVLLGTHGSGVFKSTNSGSDFSDANTGLVSSFINNGGLAISPSFATDGTLFASNFGGGVFKSVDSGQSWTVKDNGLSGSLGGNFPTLAISPDYAIDKTLFVGTQGQSVYRSVDGADSWTHLTNGMGSQQIWSLGVSPSFATDNTLFAGSITGKLYKSTDRGDHWALSNSGIGSYEIDAIAFSPDFAHDQTVFVGTLFGGIYKSTDGGATWNPTGNNSDSYSIAVSPNYAADHTLFTLHSGGIQKSEDGGATWIPIDTGSAYSSDAVALSPGYAFDHTIFALQGSNVRESMDGGVTWQQVGSDISSCAAYGMAITPGYGPNYSVFLAGSGTGVLRYNLTHSSFWTWYDDLNADDWILLGQPGSASPSDFFTLSIGGQVMNLGSFNNGLVPAGNTIYPNYPNMVSGPVKATSMDGTKGILSQRILWPRGGNSLEEVPAIDENELSDHYYWAWYDESSPGYRDWVLVANPNSTDVYYEIKIAGADPGAGSSGTLAPGQNVTPEFNGVIGGPVEVRAWTDSGKTQPANVLASQRVLSNYGGAFNEVPGTADPTGGGTSELSNDYLWTWYDNMSSGAADWILIANNDPSANMYYEIDIAGNKVADDTTGGGGIAAGPVAAGHNITPMFAEQGGPVEVKTFADTGHTIPMNSIASQRVLWGPSFEEVPGYARSRLGSDYMWTWYDEKEGPGVQNWVLVANTNAYQVYYEISIAGEPVSSGTLNQGQSITPDYPNWMGGPVEVQAWTDSGKSEPARVMTSQRIIWRGYFNEVLGQGQPSG